MTEWKVGDWVVFDLSIGQIKRMDDYQEFSDGSFCVSGRLADRFRPLTLRNKRTVEYFDYYYREIRKIDGEAGFNYPGISQHFAQLARDAMDGDDKDTVPYDKARDFIKDANNYNPVIQGIRLFRRNLSKWA